MTEQTARTREKHHQDQDDWNHAYAELCATIAGLEMDDRGPILAYARSLLRQEAGDWLAGIARRQAGFEAARAQDRAPRYGYGGPRTGAAARKALEAAPPFHTALVALDALAAMERLGDEFRAETEAFEAEEAGTNGPAATGTGG
jgi:hypothetical protein